MDIGTPNGGQQGFKTEGFRMYVYKNYGKDPIQQVLGKALDEATGDLSEVERAVESYQEGLDVQLDKRKMLREKIDALKKTLALHEPL